MKTFGIRVQNISEAFAVEYSAICCTDCENVLLSADDAAVEWKNNEFLVYHQETIDGMIRLKEAIWEQYELAE